MNLHKFAGAHDYWTHRIIGEVGIGTRFHAVEGAANCKKGGTMPNTLITSEVDFDANGKQTGYLRLPLSVHRSAYGWVPIPIVSIKNGQGPTLLLISGIHGDEYEGQIALTKLCRELLPEDIRGRLIILTMANYPAAKAGLRNSPIDSGNLNRTFPGDAHGTATQMIAHYIEEVLLPLSDYSIDLHSGGSSLFYPPTLLRGQGHTPEENQKLISLQHAFDLPFTWVFTSGGGPNTTARTAIAAAGRKGVVSIMAELGGGGTVSIDILAQTERGIRRVLNSLGMLPVYKMDEQKGTREVKVVGSVYAYDNGLFEPYKDIGDSIRHDEEAGAIHFPDEPWREPVIVRFPFDGMVLCKRFMGQVERGDAVYQIATDAK
jgi:predicted deacylase